MGKECPNGFWEEIKAIIETICNEFDAQWRKRKRIIDTQLLVSITMKTVVSKNNQGYGSILAEIWSEYEQNGIKLPQVAAVSASSLCEAIQKLSEEIFYKLSKAVLSYWESKNTPETWMGHRIFGVDGSKLNLP